MLAICAAASVPFIVKGWSVSSRVVGVSRHLCSCSCCTLHPPSRCEHVILAILF